MSDRTDTRASLVEAKQHRLQQREAKRQRVLALRRAEPDMPASVIASRLHVDYQAVKMWLSE